MQVIDEVAKLPRSMRRQVPEMQKDQKPEEVQISFKMYVSTAAQGAKSVHHIQSLSQRQDGDSPRADKDLGQERQRHVIQPTKSEKHVHTDGVGPRRSKDHAVAEYPTKVSSKSADQVVVNYRIGAGTQRLRRSRVTTPASHVAVNDHKMELEGTGPDEKSRTKQRESDTRWTMTTRNSQSGEKKQTSARDTRPETQSRRERRTRHQEPATEDAARRTTRKSRVA